MAVAETLPSAFDAWFASCHPEIPVAAARAVLELAASGASAGFIARYRGDRTSGLDVRAVRRVLEAGELAVKVRSRQAIVLESIERHATLSPELRERILATFDPDALEDLYHPYRQQKKNRALAARDAGLQPLADWIWSCGHGSEQPQEGQTLELWAFTFRNEEKGVPDAKSAIEGARDILVERLASAPELRALVRREYLEKGFLRSARTAKAKPHSRFEAYFAFEEKVATLREPQQAATYHALRRGLAEDELALSLGGAAADTEFEARLVQAFEAAACGVPDSPGAEVLRHAGRIALKNDVRTAIENEVHRVLKEAADAVVAAGFAESARRRLLAAPFGARPVLAIDPDRAACRLAALDGSGALVASRVVELATDEQKAAAGELVARLAREHAAAAVAVGDGAGGRDLELLARAAMRKAGHDAPVVLVNESGANAWSGGEAARAELPDVEPPVRAAVSIGRRLQDPLAELLKLDPKSLGTGQHHHDVPHAVLLRVLDAVIDDAVASVGVDLNAASRALLARVPGLEPAAVDAIVGHRQAGASFATRRAVLELPAVTPEAFEQAAGFLRVKGGEQALDDSAVHPETYAALEAFAARHGKATAELLGTGASLVREAAELDAELGVHAHAQVSQALEQAGRDPRPAFAPFSFRDDLRALDQLKPGMSCPGLVTNVTSFGVFVDVGVQHDGLVHVSQLGRGSGQEPLAPGDRVEVRVLRVDLEKKQVSFTMRPPARKPAAPRRPPARKPERPKTARRPAAAGAPLAPAASGPGSAPHRPRPRPAAATSERPRPSPSGPRPSRERAERPPERRPEPRRQAFNNPFAVLADLKKTGKS